MAERMVMITNMVNSLVSVKDQTYGVYRRWERRGHTLPLPYSVVEGLLWQNGFRRMIDSGILYIRDMKDKKDLGLEPQEAEEPVNIIALTEVQIENLLKNVPMTVFKKEISKLPRVQVDNMIEYAIENKIIDHEKCAFLKTVTGKDILAAISSREKDAALDKAEEERRRRAELEGRRI